MEPLIDIEIEDERWLDTLPEVGEIVEAGIAAALKAAKFTEQADVVVLLCDDAEMRQLNAEYRNKDKATNVLSFPAPKSMRVKGVLEHLGDMALGYETCVREAKEQNKPLNHHVTHLAVHGALHLLGHDHMNDAEAETMEALERDILAGLGVPDPYAQDHANG